MIDERSYIPKGFEDLQATEIEIKEEITQTLKQLFKRNGYMQVQTPIFEYYDLFTKIEGTINKNQMIKLIDSDGKVLVLRPDATIPIARMVATNFRDSNKMYKFSYVTSIFRLRDENRRIPSREFTQAGVEWFGKGGPEEDAEIIKLAIQSLLLLGVNHFKVDLGQAKFYKTLIDQIELDQEEMISIQRLIENKNVTELEAKILDLELEESYKKALLTIPLLYGKPENVLISAKNICLNDEMFAEILRLEQVFNILKDEGYEKYLSIDLGLINHLNYYTSIIFQAYVDGYGKPVIIGGRYDQLTNLFGYASKAIGFGIYLDDLFESLNKNNT